MEQEAAVMLIGGMAIFSLLMLFKSVVRYCCGNENCGGPIVIWLLWGLISMKLFLNGCMVLDQKDRVKSLSLDEQYEAAVQEEKEHNDVKVKSP